MYQVKWSKMKKRFYARLFTLRLSLLFLILISSCILVLGNVVVPVNYYGKATINGRDVPSGSTLAALIDGVRRGSVIVGENGEFGKFIQGTFAVMDGQNGDTVTFVVQTPSMQNWISAKETAEYYAGESIGLSLTFNGTEVAKTDGGGGSGGGGGGGGGGSSSSGSSTTSSTPTKPTTISVPQASTPTTPAEPETFEEVEEQPKTRAEEIGEGKTFTLSKGGAIDFTYDGEEYKLIVKAVGLDSAILVLSSSDEEISISKGETKELDVNNNVFPDMTVTLDDVKGGSVTLTLAEIKGLGGITGAAVLNFGATNPIIGAIIVLGIVGIGLLLYFIIIKK